jgi:hypothetical protein
MPKVEAGENREHYMSRCMIYPDLQKHPENVRAAICEHLYDRESKEEGTPGEHKEDHEHKEGISTEDPKFMHFEGLDLGNPRIDHEKGILYHVHVLGPKSHHGYEYAMDAIAVATPKFEGLRVGINHDYRNNPLKVEDSWGTLTNPSYDDEGVWADLHYLKTHILTEQILEDLERKTGIYALSSVNAYPPRDEGKKICTAFLPTRVDVVAGGGATTKTFFESASLPAVSAVPVESPDIVALKAEIESLKAKQAESDARFVKYEQYVAPSAKLKDTIATVLQEHSDRGLDLTAFWSKRAEERRVEDANNQVVR